MENTAIKYAFTVSYNGVDITKAIQPHVISLTYKDHTEGKSDELEIKVEDTDGLWSSGWYPTKGAKIVAQIGYPHLLLPCGTFLVDEIEMEGPPDTVTMKAVAAGFTSALRTRNSFRHELKSLQQIVNTVAAKNGLTVTGSSLPAINIANATQFRETDLQFLHRLSKDYGCVFSIRGNSLVFTNLFDLELKDATTTLDRKDLTSYHLTDKSAKIYKKGKVSYHSPVTNSAVSASADPGDIVGDFTNDDNISFSEIESQDTLEIRDRVESQQQASLKARSRLYHHNSKQQVMEIELEGNVALMAGVNINLTGMGINSGTWNIFESDHSITRSEGYKTKAKGKRLKAKMSKKGKGDKNLVPTTITNADNLQFSQITTK